MVHSLHSLDIEDGVLRVHRGLVLRSLADQALFGREGNEGWSGERALLVGNDFNAGPLVPVSMQAIDSSQ